jgi:DNA-binding PadR family transcriptional regulator
VNLFTRWRRGRREEVENRVLAALQADEWTSDFDLWRTTRIRCGRLYPTLKRLEEHGWVQGDWAEGSTRPRRRMYRRTDGEALRQAISNLSDDDLHRLIRGRGT